MSKCDFESIKLKEKSSKKKPEEESTLFTEEDFKKFEREYMG